MITRRRLTGWWLAVVMVVLAGWSTPTLAADRPAHPIADATRAPAADPDLVSYRPQPIPLSAPEIPNELRGMYSWLGVPPDPAGWPLRDVYYRDAVNWETIEPTAGTYDFAAFDRGLAAAKARGGRFGFRVMAYSPGWGDDVAPAYLPRQPGTDVIDWNSETVLSAWESLMGALGARYADDPRLGWVDVGGYGSWGEWHNYDLPGAEITDTNAARMIRAVVAAFPSSHIVINASTARFATTAVAMTPRMGLRVDCLGEPDGMWSALPGAPGLHDVWQHAPVIGEWCNSATTDMTAGLTQVRTYHFSTVSSGNLAVPYSSMTPDQQDAYLTAVKVSGYRYQLRELTLPATLRPGRRVEVTSRWRNVGVAPTYDRWRVQLQLRRIGGGPVASAPLGIDLRTVLPSSRSFTRSVRVGDLPPGRYRVRIAVRPRGGYLAPMRLASAGRHRDGSYVLGRVRVA